MIVSAVFWRKTTLLRAVIGELAPTSGRLTLGANTKVAYFDQERTGLDDDKTVFENVSEGGAIEIGGERIEPRVYLERFLFDAHKQRQKVSSLSGGERAGTGLDLKKHNLPQLTVAHAIENHEIHWGAEKSHILRVVSKVSNVRCKVLGDLPCHNRGASANSIVTNLVFVLMEPSLGCC